MSFFTGTSIYKKFNKMYGLDEMRFPHKGRYRNFLISPESSLLNTKKLRKLEKEQGNS